MALLEDIVSMIIVVFVLLIVGSMIAGTLFTERASNLENEQTRYLEDYYATSVNNFVNYRESNTGLPVHVLIGNYISRGEERVVSLDGDIINIEEELDDVLREFYGENNYYMTVRQDYVDTTLSFVIDGSDSVRIEREIIGEEIGNILEFVSTMFGDAEAEVTGKVYILEGIDDKDLCDDFPTDIVSCERITHSGLYGDSDDVLEMIPDFGEPQNTHYLQSDWISGSLLAEKNFREDLEGSGVQEEVHIMIPVFDQVSSSSVPDVCFDESNPDYTICRLCHEEEGEDCSAVERNAENLVNVTNFINERTPNSVVMPVFSFDCNFQDFFVWKQYSPGEDYEQYMSGVEGLAADESLCSLDSCGACDLDGDLSPVPEEDEDMYSNVCFRSSCQQDIEDQMQYIASNTGGLSVSIDDREDITDIIAETIEDVFDERRIEFGVQDPDRTRYVFERTIVLPSLGDTQVYLQVYEVPRAIGG